MQHDVGRFIALPNHLGHLSTSHNPHSRDTGADVGTSYGVIGEVGAHLISVPIVLRGTRRSCVLGRR